jgi:hypothetical protein
MSYRTHEELPPKAANVACGRRLLGQHDGLDGRDSLAVMAPPTHPSSTERRRRRRRRVEL